MSLAPPIPGRLYGLVALTLVAGSTPSPRSTETLANSGSQEGEEARQKNAGDHGGGSRRTIGCFSGMNVDDPSHVIGNVVGEVNSCHVEVHAVEPHDGRVTVNQDGALVALFRTVQNRAGIEECDPVVPGGLLFADLVDHLHIFRQLGVLHRRLADPEHLGAFNATSPQLRTLAEYQVGSGLGSPEYFDWQHHLLAVVAALQPKLVIYMGSANDGQDLFVDGAFQPVGSRLWRKAYADRVAGIMTALVREGSKVLWIGEPAMQDPQLSEYMQVIDQVCEQQAARHHGVTFFNPGAVLNGPKARYESTVLIHRDPTVVRLDGVHLNMAGSIYLADYIADYVARIINVHTAETADRPTGPASVVPPGILLYHFSPS